MSLPLLSGDIESVRATVGLQNATLGKFTGREYERSTTPRSGPTRGQPFSFLFRNGLAVSPSPKPKAARCRRPYISPTKELCRSASSKLQRKSEQKRRRWMSDILLTISEEATRS